MQLFQGNVAHHCGSSGSLVDNMGSSEAFLALVHLASGVARDSRPSCQQLTQHNALLSAAWLRVGTNEPSGVPSPALGGSQLRLEQPQTLNEHWLWPGPRLGRLSELRNTRSGSKEHRPLMGSQSSVLQPASAGGLRSLDVRARRQNSFLTV